MLVCDVAHEVERLARKGKAEAARIAVILQLKDSDLRFQLVSLLRDRVEFLLWPHFRFLASETLWNPAPENRMGCGRTMP